MDCRIFMIRLDQYGIFCIYWYDVSLKLLVTVMALWDPSHVYTTQCCARRSSSVVHLISGSVASNIQLIIDNNPAFLVMVLYSAAPFTSVLRFYTAWKEMILGSSLGQLCKWSLLNVVLCLTRLHGQHLCLLP